MNKQELKRLCKGLKVKETGMYTKGYNIGINAVLSALLSQGNPPLKFEELKPGMWVWDRELSAYIQIYAIYDTVKGIRVSSFGTFEFEENRYFRYEVKEVKE